MASVDIRRLDFTLLQVLASLLRTRKSTLTAAELHVTQSTVSHALARLRDVLGDPLFVRRPHGLEPTARALALAPAVEALLSLARTVMTAPDFDPRAATGTLRIAAADYHCALMAGTLLAQLEREAPDLRVSFRPLLRRSAVDAVAIGEVDLAVGHFWALPASVAVRPLFEESYAVVARSGHPTLAAGLDLDAYCTVRHIVVSLDGALDGIVDRVLEGHGRNRTVVAAVPYFLAALATVSESDAVATLPGRIARAHADRFGLAIHEPPVAIRRFTVSTLTSVAGSHGGVAGWVAGEVLPAIVGAGP